MLMMAAVRYEPRPTSVVAALSPMITCAAESFASVLGGSKAMVGA